MSDQRDALAEVLAGHEMVGKSIPARGWREHGCPMVVQSACQCQRIVIGCTGCDWQTEADGTQADAHCAHVAEQIEPLIQQAEMRGAVRALREAADDLEGHQSRAAVLAQRALRERADRIAGQP